ncbi:MAG: translation initiation factor IF-6 [Candidatus ainarchaeum sp.]|nr:translation initiation factor IF-6 [Candidatus ainarchaeum sp.]
MKKTSYHGNDWIGMFVRANNEFTLVPIDSTNKFTDAFEENLKTRCIKTSMGGTDILGSYIAMNSNGIILPNIAFPEEIEKIKKETGLNVYVNKSIHNSNGSNIVVNDKGGIINPRIDKKDRKVIEEVLQIELHEMEISGYFTVGSNVIANNKGFIANFKISEEEMEKMGEIFKVKGMKGTINMGTGFVSIGVVANDNGYVVGNMSTSYEMGRVEESLGYL